MPLLPIPRRMSSSARCLARARTARCMKTPRSPSPTVLSAARCSVAARERVLIKAVCGMTITLKLQKMTIWKLTSICAASPLVRCMATRRLKSQVALSRTMSTAAATWPRWARATIWVMARCRMSVLSPRLQHHTRAAASALSKSTAAPSAPTACRIQTATSTASCLALQRASRSPRSAILRTHRAMTTAATSSSAIPTRLRSPSARLLAREHPAFGALCSAAARTAMCAGTPKSPSTRAKSVWHILATAVLRRLLPTIGCTAAMCMARVVVSTRLSALPPTTALRPVPSPSTPR